MGTIVLGSVSGWRERSDIRLGTPTVINRPDPSHIPIALLISLETALNGALGVAFSRPDLYL